MYSPPKTKLKPDPYPLGSENYSIDSINSIPSQRRQKRSQGGASEPQEELIIAGRERMNRTEPQLDGRWRARPVEMPVLVPDVLVHLARKVNPF